MPKSKVIFQPTQFSFETPSIERVSRTPSAAFQSHNWPRWTHHANIQPQLITSCTFKTAQP